MANGAINAMNKSRRSDVTVYDAKPPGLLVYMASVVKNRHLIGILAWQEIKGLYAQTYFGILWAVIRPLLLTVIFTIFFQGLLNVHTESPYYLFAFTGMISWNFFANITTQSSGIMIHRRDLIRKLKFPKIILPLYKVLVACVEAFIALVILIVLIAVKGLPMHWGLLTLPLFMLLNICCAFMLAVWVNALSIKYRDLYHLLPTLVGTGIWLTPVFFPTTILSKQLMTLLYLNPMAGVLQGFRYALLGEHFPEWQYFISIGITLILMVAGSWYLSRVEDQIVDYA